jgi:heat shock protein HslJ
MRRLLFIALIVSATALLAACGAAGGGLTGQTWQLTAITEKVPAFQGVVPAEEQANYTITFNDDGTYAARADCNQTGGTYETSGSNGLTITPGLSTMAFCGEFSLDTLYVHALSQAASYAIADGTLTITLQDEGTLTFVAASSSESAAPAESSAAASPATEPTTAPAPAGSAVPGAGLIGKAWQLTAITEKVPAFQGVVPEADQSRYTVEFLADGTFTATADCNSVGGSYTTADPAAASGDIEILPGPSTLVACPEGSLGDLFTIGLGSASSYAVADGILTLTLADGGTLEFK